MKRIILTSICLFLISPLGYCQELKQHLQLTIKSDKQVYVVGEAINITASISNKDKDSIKIYSPDYWGVSEIIIKNSKGIVMKPRGLKIERRHFESFMSIPPQGVRTHTFENLIWFHCGGAWQFIDDAELPADIYTLAVSITNPPQTQRCGESHKYEITGLSGTLNSNTITIEVVEKKVSKEDALEIAEKVCRESGWAWKDVSIQEGSEEWKITTNSKADGMNAFITVDKKTGKVLYKNFGPR